MSRRLTRSYYIVSIAMFSALAIVFDVFSDAFPLRAPWGMKVDFVGTMWVLSYFLYGLSVAFPVSVITTLYIIFGPTPTGFVGGVMKFIATIPMFLIPELVSYLPFFKKRSAQIFSGLFVVIGVCFLASVVRLLVATTANLYWAIPTFYNMTPEQALSYFGGLWALIVYIAGFNVLQGIVDIVVSWFLAFKFKLSMMYGTW